MKTLRLIFAYGTYRIVTTSDANEPCVPDRHVDTGGCIPGSDLAFAIMELQRVAGADEIVIASANSK